MRSLAIAILIYIPIISFGVLPSFATQSNTNLPACVQNIDDFDCFQKNFKELFQTNNKLFWQHWRHHEDKANSCSSLLFTARFISLVRKCDGATAEVMAEFIENMILRDPACLIGAAEKLEPNIMEHLIRYYILTPLYHEPSEILPIVEKELQKKKNQKFNKIYANIKNSKS